MNKLRTVLYSLMLICFALLAGLPHITSAYPALSSNPPEYILQSAHLLYPVVLVLLLMVIAGILLLKMDTAREIERSKKDKGQLIRTSQEWAAAMDVSEDAIYILDPDRHLVTANKTFYLMTDSSAATAVGRHIEHIVHPQGEAVPCPVCRAQKEKRDTVILLEPDHPDNPTGKAIEVTVSIVRDEQGLPLSIFMRLHDLSNQRAAEDALRKSKEEWEMTFNSMSDIITIQNKQMQIIQANKAAYDFFEVADGELEGRYCYEVFRGTQHPCPQCPELATISAKTPNSATIKHKKLGKVFYVSSSPNRGTRWLNQ